jgi:type III pantothenate kinase
VGNSRLKWAWLEGENLRPGKSFPSRSADLAGALDAAWGELARPEKIQGCNVAGEEVRVAVESWTAARWGQPCRWVAAAAAAHGVTNGYAEPARLGADRWLALIAARRFFPGPLCVADCGTAITVDALDGEGNHLGGVIAPGLTAMERALPAGIVAAAENGGVPSLGRDTATAARSGILHAAAGAIERVHAHCRERYNENPVLILTGGDAACLSPLLSLSHRLDPDLLLRGLGWLATLE